MDDTEIKLLNHAYKIIVYSLKTNSWRLMKDFNIGAPKIMEFECLHYAGGKVYWSLFDEGDSWKSGDSWKIGCFDSENETYEIMDRPNCKETSYYWFGEIGGWLSLICDYETYLVDVWVMKEYSWIKVGSIDNDFGVPFDSSCYCTQSVGLARNCEILCVLRSVLFLYNPQLIHFVGIHRWVVL
ncbi:OLC1v1019149C1 [Oldenlandia corymbosa var. corymbosa]|uniref:OLC1v1019149C1 n=1 Tax=Oldenlandia corymbosa var. corymbosa TaxID=529605 RepID=A0AAV1EDN4_OLDCO|nr:OLC1v1019149C1 [Oldenlandia corymbosa var. corymbosa]